MIIDIKDDGKGIDVDKIKEKVVQKGWLKPSVLNKMSQEEIISFIFEPGFSTNDTLNSIFGRGLGMDVVKKGLILLAATLK